METFNWCLEGLGGLCVSCDLVLSRTTSTGTLVGVVWVGWELSWGCFLMQTHVCWLTAHILFWGCEWKKNNIALFSHTNMITSKRKRLQREEMWVWSKNVPLQFVGRNPRCICADKLDWVGKLLSDVYGGVMWMLNSFLVSGVQRECSYKLQGCTHILQ